MGYRMWCMHKIQVQIRVFAFHQHVLCRATATCKFALTNDERTEQLKLSWSEFRTNYGFSSGMHRICFAVYETSVRAPHWISLEKCFRNCCRMILFNWFHSLFHRCANSKCKLHFPGMHNLSMIAISISIWISDFPLNSHCFIELP